MKVIGFFIRSDDDIVKRVKRLVKRTRLSKSDISRICLRDGLPRLERKLKAESK